MSHTKKYTVKNLQKLQFENFIYYIIDYALSYMVTEASPVL